MQALAFALVLTCVLHTSAQPPLTDASFPAQSILIEAAVAFTGVIEAIEERPHQDNARAGTSHQQRLRIRITRVHKAGESGIQEGDKLHVVVGGFPHWCVDMRRPPYMLDVNFLKLSFLVRRFSVLRFGEKDIGKEHTFVFQTARRPQPPGRLPLYRRRRWHKGHRKESVITIDKSRPGRLPSPHEKWWGITISVSRVLPGTGANNSAARYLRIKSLQVNVRCMGPWKAERPWDEKCTIVCHGRLDPDADYVGDVSVYSW